jgi:glutathione S-transferase
MAPTLELIYFDIHNGRAEPARLALHIGGVPFTDTRIAPKSFGETKLSYPFGQLPVLRVGDVMLSQCNAINRYVGKLTGLYPEGALDGAQCDEVMEALEDVNHQFARSLHIADPVRFEATRKKVVAGPVSFAAERLGQRLARSGDEWFAGGQLSVADLKCFVWVRTLLSGKLDHVPADLFSRLAPNLVEHHDRVAAQPEIRAYYAQLGM